VNTLTALEFLQLKSHLKVYADKVSIALLVSQHRKIVLDSTAASLIYKVIKLS
jgi:hypothetical protein